MLRHVGRQLQSVTPKKSTSRDEFYVNHTILKEMQKRRKRDAELKSRSFWVKTGIHPGVIPATIKIAASGIIVYWMTRTAPIPWYVDDGGNSLWSYQYYTSEEIKHGK